MNDKKTYIFYENWLITLSKLPDKEAGILIKTMSNYMLGNEVKIDDPVIDAIWQGFKPIIDENNHLWENTRQARSDAGRKGMENRWRSNNKAITKDNKAITKDNKAITKDNKAITKDNNVKNADNKSLLNVNVNENVNENIKEKNTKKENSIDETKAPAEGITVSAKPWDEFWSLYGKYKKAGERFAMLAFNNAAITTDQEEIISGLKKVIDLQWSRYPKSKLQFIPKAENWLKGECWKDDVKPYEPSGGERVKLKLPSWAEDDKPKESKPASKKQLEEIKQLQKQMQEIT